jgi:hypothetical protein
MVAVVAPHDAAKHFEHVFQTDRPVDHGEGPLAEGVAETTDAVAGVGLRRPHDHGRRRLVEPSEELEHARSGRDRPRAPGLHGNREVDDRDVNRSSARCTAEELGRFDAAAAPVAVDPERTEERGKLIREVAVPPSSRGKHQTEPPRPPVAATRARSGRRLRRIRVWGVEAEVHGMSSVEEESSRGNCRADRRDDANRVAFRVRGSTGEPKSAGAGAPRAFSPIATR